MVPTSPSSNGMDSDISILSPMPFKKPAVGDDTPGVSALDIDIDTSLARATNSLDISGEVADCSIISETSSSAHWSGMRNSRRRSIKDLSQTELMTPQSLQNRGMGIQWPKGPAICTVDVGLGEMSERVKQLCIIPTPELGQKLRSPPRSPSASSQDLESPGARQRRFNELVRHASNAQSPLILDSPNSPATSSTTGGMASTSRLHAEKAATPTQLWASIVDLGRPQKRDVPVPKQAAKQTACCPAQEPTKKQPSDGYPTTRCPSLAASPVPGRRTLVDSCPGSMQLLPKAPATAAVPCKRSDHQRPPSSCPVQLQITKGRKSVAAKTQAPTTTRSVAKVQPASTGPGPNIILRTGTRTSLNDLRSLSASAGRLEPSAQCREEAVCYVGQSTSQVPRAFVPVLSTPSASPRAITCSSRSTAADGFTNPQRTLRCVRPPVKRMFSGSMVPSMHSSKQPTLTC